MALLSLSHICCTLAMPCATVCSVCVLYHVIMVLSHMNKLIKLAPDRCAGNKRETVPFYLFTIRNVFIDDII